MLQSEYHLSKYLQNIRKIHHRLLENKHRILRSPNLSKDQKIILVKIINRLDRKAELVEHKVIHKLNVRRKFLLENTDGNEETFNTDLLPPIDQIVPVGSIYYSSWGYDQTNVEFYQVVGHTGKKTVVLKRIAAKPAAQAGGHSYEHIVPVPNKFIKDEIFKARVISYDKSPDRLRQLVATKKLPNLKISGKDAAYNYIYPYDVGEKGVYTSWTH